MFCRASRLEYIRSVDGITTLKMVWLDTLFKGLYASSLQRSLRGSYIHVDLVVMRRLPAKGPKMRFPMLMVREQWLLMSFYTIGNTNQDATTSYETRVVPMH